MYIMEKLKIIRMFRNIISMEEKINVGKFQDLLMEGIR